MPPVLPLPLGKYLHLFGHYKLRILVDQFNIANISYAGYNNIMNVVSF